MGPKAFVFSAFPKIMSQKTRKAMAKRFKVTGTGKVMRRKPNHRHLLRSKSSKQKRSMRQDQPVADGYVKQLRVGLPHHNI